MISILDYKFVHCIIVRKILCLLWMSIDLLLLVTVVSEESGSLRLLQREARGSVTFKIVPSYRSAPPPCEVQVRPNTQTLSQNTIASSKPTSSTASTGASSGGGVNKSGKPVKTSAVTSKEKTPKASKTSKSKSASSSTESTPRRRLNPLSALRSRKS